MTMAPDPQHTYSNEAEETKTFMRSQIEKKTLVSMVVHTYLSALRVDLGISRTAYIGLRFQVSFK